MSPRAVGGDRRRRVTPVPRPPRRDRLEPRTGALSGLGRGAAQRRRPRQARERGERLRDAASSASSPATCCAPARPPRSCARSSAATSPLSVDPRLAETDRGDWETRTFGEIMANEPDAWAAYREHPETFRFPRARAWPSSSDACSRRCATRPRRAAPRCSSRTAAASVCCALCRRARHRLVPRRGAPNGEALELDRTAWRRASTRPRVARPRPAGRRNARRPGEATGGGCA